MRLQGQSSAWTWLTALLFGVACTCRGSLVKVNMGLKVRRGQVAHLQQEDLQFHVPHEKDACKVEVVMNEPMTQRVGKLMPQVMEVQFDTQAENIESITQLVYSWSFCHQSF